MLFMMIIENIKDYVIEKRLNAEKLCPEFNSLAYKKFLI